VSARAGELRRLELRALAAVCAREALWVRRFWLHTVAGTSALALVFMLVFGGALAGRVGRVDGVPYLAFIFPGLLVMTVASQSLGSASVRLVSGKYEETLDELLSAPIARWKLVAGYLSGSVVRSLLSSCVLLAIAAVFVGTPARPGLLVAALAATVLCAGTLGLLVGLAADGYDTQGQVMSMVVQPLTLVAGVFYRAGSLPSPWRTLTRVDPLFYLVDATRAGFTGRHEVPVALSLGVTLAVAAVALLTAALLFARGWKLRP
jgi:ABC-2 type transport system permease protein